MRKIVYVILFCLPLNVLLSVDVALKNWPQIKEYFVSQNIKTKFYQLTKPSVKGLQLRYLHLNKNSKNLIFISPGRGEVIEKYYEVIYELRDLDADIVVVDQLGQGLSSRLIENKKVGYIKSYDQYSDSLVELLKGQDLAHYEKRFAIGHSMGGVIVHLINNKYADLFKYSILTSPSFKIRFGSMPSWVALPVLKIMSLFGMDESFGPGLGPFKRTSFEDNTLTNSPLHFKHFRNDIYLEDNQFGMLGINGNIGGPSVHWILETVEIGKKFQEDKAYLSKSPFTIVQSQKDIVVNNEGQNKVCDFNSNCTLVVLKDSKHEPFIETLEIRSRLYNIIKEKFSKTIFP